MIADAAHNPAGVAVTVAAITETFHFSGSSASSRSLADKDVAGVLDELEPVLSRDRGDY